MKLSSLLPAILGFSRRGAFAAVISPDSGIPSRQGAAVTLQDENFGSQAASVATTPDSVVQHQDIARNAVTRVDRIRDVSSLEDSRPLKRRDKPEFKVTYTITDATVSGNDYLDFLTDLQHRVQAFCDRPYPGECYLPPLAMNASSPDSSWFEIEIQSQNADGTTESSVTFRLRRSNLYVDAFRPSTSERWIEFDNTGHVSYIQGSQNLGFHGDYPRLRQEGALRENVRVGHHRLRDAVRGLAKGNYDPRNQAQRQATAKNLLVVVQMFSEALRFSTFARNIANNYMEHDGHPVAQQYQELQNTWGGLSNRVRMQRAWDRENPGQTTNTYFPITIMNQQIDYAMALRIIAIFLGPKTNSKLPPKPRAANIAPRAGATTGRELAELVSVRTGYMAGNPESDLYGTVKLDDGLGAYSLYERPRDHSESFGLNQDLGLQFLTRSLEAADSFTLNVELMMKNTPPFDDIQLIKDVVVWNPYDGTNKYDQVITQTVKGAKGDAQVRFVVMSDAAEATIHVVLKDAKGEDPAKIYGTVSAATKYRTYALYDDPEGLWSKMLPGQEVNLIGGSRERGPTPVSRGDKIRIDVDLWHHNAFFSNRQVAKGTVELEPLILHSNSKTLQTEYGVWEVGVTWT
ncbi:Ribosome-inactivating protein [Moelleriella libera RCEF 2490]|uniref:rRNA N-glycosylase n=1 Tax=Moelleriella libera RCEF 2490 TaxID=1081109 RepID=A0A168BH79_9HYPO|nr:Ribosome-inactivating protein [Moelleriella libera RCEF 2490]